MIRNSLRPSAVMTLILVAGTISQAANLHLEIERFVELKSALGSETITVRVVSRDPSQDVVLVERPSERFSLVHHRQLSPDSVQLIQRLQGVTCTDFRLFQTWTDQATGKTTEASLLHYDKTNRQLLMMRKTDRRIFLVPISRLTPKNRHDALEHLGIHDSKVSFSSMESDVELIATPKGVADQVTSLTGLESASILPTEETRPSFEATAAGRESVSVHVLSCNSATVSHVVGYSVVHVQRTVKCGCKTIRYWEPVYCPIYASPKSAVQSALEDDGSGSVAWQPNDEFESELGAPPRSASDVNVVPDKFAL